MSKVNPRYPRYQDYVISNGKLVGEFEQMYQDYDDPWGQSRIEEWASEKVAVLNLMKKLRVRKGIELGCGLGHYTKRIADIGIDVIGVDISETAIQKARVNYPGCNYVNGDVLDFDIYRQFRPDIIVMAELTWYILEKLDRFLQFMKTEFPDTYLIHLLTTYPDGVQKYGRDKFTNLMEIMTYFDVHYYEWGEISYSGREGSKRTYFLAQFKPSKA